MLCKACVSTSSVTKTLLTFSSRRSGWPLSIFIYPFYVSGVLLVQLYSVVRVIGGHIGENHHIPYLQAIFHFNGVHCGTSQNHFHLIRKPSVLLEFKELDCGVLLAENRPLHRYHVVQLFQNDGSVDAQIGPCAIRQTFLADDQ